jgi:hypothetical protein
VLSLGFSLTGWIHGSLRGLKLAVVYNVPYIIDFNHAHPPGDRRKAGQELDSLEDVPEIMEQAVYLCVRTWLARIYTPMCDSINRHD